jgi:hypothetical protein
MKPIEIPRQYIWENSPESIEESLRVAFSNILNNEYVVSASYNPETRIAEVILSKKSIDYINISFTVTDKGIEPPKE